MLNHRPTILFTCCLLIGTQVYAADPQQTTDSAQTQQELTQIKDIKAQLFKDLDSGDIKTDTFDEKTELDIAKNQMAIAKYYYSQGDRKYALICAIIARRIFQHVYNNINDPRLVEIYSLLVQIYSSNVDIEEPGKDVADADKARMYREMVDHIHAE